MILLLGPEGWVIRMSSFLRDSDAKIVTARTAGRMHGTREHIEVIVCREPERWITRQDEDAYALARILNETLGERIEQNQLKTRTIRSSIRVDDELLVREDRHRLQDLLRRLVAREAGYMLETALKDTGVDQHSPLWLRFEGPQPDHRRYQTQLPMDLTYTPGNIPEPTRPRVRPPVSAMPDDWGDLTVQRELPMSRPSLDAPTES